MTAKRILTSRLKRKTNNRKVASAHPSPSRSLRRRATLCQALDHLELRMNARRTNPTLESLRPSRRSEGTPRKERSASTLCKLERRLAMLDSGSPSSGRLHQVLPPASSANSSNSKRSDLGAPLTAIAGGSTARTRTRLGEEDDNECEDQRDPARRYPAASGPNSCRASPSSPLLSVLRVHQNSKLISC